MEVLTKGMKMSQLAQPSKILQMRQRVVDLFRSKESELMKLIPQQLDSKRLLKIAQIAIMSTPKLMECDVASLLTAVGQCAQLGLEPNTPMGLSYLVPFSTKRNGQFVNSVQVVIGYKGLINLARRSGQIVSIAAHEVCEKDKFELVYGLDEKLNHTPAMGERGEVIGFYAVAKLKDGGHCFEFMSRHQIEAVRENSQGFQQAKKYDKSDKHLWTVHFIEMGRKTVIRRLAKYLPMTAEFTTALGLQATAEAGVDQNIEVFQGEYQTVADPSTFLVNDEAPEYSQQEVLDAEPSAQPDEKPKRAGKPVKPKPQPDPEPIAQPDQKPKPAEKPTEDGKVVDADFFEVPDIRDDTDVADDIFGDD